MNKRYIIDNLLFIRNRAKLSSLMKRNSLAIIHSNDEMPRNGDQYFSYRQSSDLFYLTGIKQEKTILCLFPDNLDDKRQEVLFVLEPDEKKEIWNGHRLNKSEVTEISGIDSVFYINDYEIVFRELLACANIVYLLQNDNVKFTPEVQNRNHRLAITFRNEYPTFVFERLSPLLTKLRLIKEEDEIELLKIASLITNKAFDRVLRTIKPEMYEYEIEAEISYEFNKNGAKSHAYSPIVASGKNACILHYVSNNCVCINGDLVLLDFGAEYNNYAADCSRTIPVNGKFSKRQAECYESVLQVFNKLKRLYVPGNTINILNDEANRLMEIEMIKLGLFSQIDIEDNKGNTPLYIRYFMHGVSHFIGLDVHDVGEKNVVFEKGMVLTCEPGIYIPEENIGIRIENDIIVDENPIDLMKDIPLEIDEIEYIINNK